MADAAGGADARALTPGQAARRAWGEHWAKAPERGRGKPGWDSLAYEAECWEAAAGAAIEAAAGSGAICVNAKITLTPTA